MHEGPRDPAASSAWERDLQLVCAARSGDPAALEAFIERLARVPAMVRAKHRRLGHPLDEAALDDVVQETLTGAWAKLGTFAGRSSLETWLFRFGANELLRGIQRRERSRERPGLGEPRSDDARTSEAETLWVLEGLAALPEDEAELVRAKHFDELTFEAIAGALGEPVGTIKSRYYRAMQRLRRALAPQWERIRTP